MPEARRPTAGPATVMPRDLSVCDVVLRGRVVVHVAVHGGADDDGGAGSEHRGREGVVRQPVGDARYGVGGRGGNDHQVGALRDGHVVYTQLGARVEYVGDDRAMGDAAEGERRREPGCRLGHDDVYHCAVLGQLAGKVYSLVAGDAARDSQRYGLAFQRVRHVVASLSGSIRGRCSGRKG